ncbi:MAG: hypothetical protein IJ364_00105 [Oscillospiraceae bacterium]|nr:hypothetical protein [Oscillospiraceae bacterium]
MKELIYNQENIPRRQWRYGFRASAATGCGWIAAYNALRLMGYYIQPEKLIKSYEHHLPLLNGPFGTFILEPASFFKKRGFPVKISARQRRFDEIVKANDVGILFYYWRRKFKLGAHFVTVQYKDGRFIGYNTFKNSVGPDNYGISLESFLKKQKFFFPVLMAIKDKRKKRGLV